MKNLYLYIVVWALLLVQYNSFAQCTNTSSFGGGAAPTAGGSLAMAGCNYATEYATVTGVAAATNYRVTSSIATDFITVHQGTFNGPVIAFGVQPLNWTSTVAGTYYIHINTNAACGTNTTCRATTLIHMPSACSNATSSGTSIAAPALGATATIMACHRADRYSTITGVVAGGNYTCTSSIATDFITIRQGGAGPGTTVIASGTAPLTWTATVAGTYYVHYNTNSACGTSTTCRNTTITRNNPACTNAIAFGSTNAPTGGATITISTCNYATEYNTINAVPAATSYVSASSVATDYITVRQGTSGGTVIAAGLTPLSWTSTVAGTYYIHYNTNSACGTASTCRTTTIQHVLIGCNNAVANGSVAAPNNGATATIAACMNAGQYGTVTGCASGASYTCTSSVGTDFITVRQTTPGGTIIASGTSPLVWTAPAAGTYYIHYNTSSACGSQAVCRTATITHNPVICTNTVAFGTVTAPVNARVTISTCTYAGEYATVNGCTAGTTYTSYTNLLGGYFTVHQGTYNGPVVGSGTAPLTWTTTVAGTYYVHLNTTSSCGTDAICHTTEIEHTCIPAPTALSATPNSVCPGSTSNLRATSAGNTIRWYTVATGGTSIGSSASNANFAVNPLVNTTYYAEAFNGTCAGPRAPISVAVVPGPNTPTSVTATPATLCVGASTNLTGISNGSVIVYDFDGVYDPSMWTISHAPATDVGTVNTAGAPNSISITSSNGGNSGIHSVLWTVTVPAAGNITFDWDYVTTDVDGSGFDYPQYAINGVIVGNISGFVSGGPNSQSGSCTIAVTAGQTFSLVMTASDDVLGAATTVFSNFTGPDLFPGTIYWYTVATGGTNIGSSASGANFPITPGATTTYYAEGYANGCYSPARTPVTVTVNTPSTTPIMDPVSPSYCPNTTITLTAAGGTAGSGSNIYWYTGPNGTGTFVGTGTSINVTPTANTTYYIRREGTCNTTTDDSDVVVLKNYIYATNGTSSSSYCTDNSGWNHFYVGNNIILSILGNLSAAGTVTATIGDNGAYFLDPGTPALCAGEAQFEMERNWNIGYTGSLIGSYDIRYYFEPAERTNVINAANAWIAAYPACSYTYKYTINPNGWFWFKNQGTAYTAPDYDDDGTFTMLASGGAGTTPNGINYATMAGVTSFSGGTGGVILTPDPLLNTAWLYFEGETNNKTNFLRWATESEQNSAHFNIQRSKDGTNFTTIGTVGAQGNSTTTHHYTFNDETPFTGDNYYRLELVGTDAKIAYSNTIRLVIADDGRGYSFYPNPTQNIVNYQYEATEKAPLEIEVIDVYGRTLLKKQVTTQVGLNRIPVNLTEFAAGAYMIRVNHLNSGNVHVNKVILDK
jgi:hypothetical protein